ncbi:DUF1848 domain-containing protein [Desulfosporosinus sp. OT]|uniref:DUF1848 domain-containing protein n=1 Tax=Desulfosporosinus sp. OT TaxID=913865 RepID=UPI000223A7F4|nr:DUF1848 domain-containing protein [Desulfosporosinus sp. OT]EGW37057.1 hypothetical protein DOT_5051 [Desulfosporosinus sp. OT]
MIISASRRTDIPAFYSEWLINRLQEGYALMPNPRNPNRLGRVELSPDIVDCIAFWTKNPKPMFDRLKQLDAMGYSYYIQFTLTPYNETVESGLPPKSELIEAFIEMSKLTSAQRSVWRYDPIFVDAKHSVDWHVGLFAEMCERLHAYTERCVLSFVDPYKSISDRYRIMTHNEMIAIASHFSRIAQKHNIVLYTCAEEIDLAEYGIRHGACIEQKLVEQIIGRPVSAKKDANQRAACCCIESVDIGAYDTCTHGCTYCYATSSQKTALRRVALHNPKAPMITGYPRGDEIITDRTTPSQIFSQLSMF